MMLPVETERLG